MALAERGQHVLRFDYRGTGDSFGELAEVSVHDWVEDIALAVREEPVVCSGLDDAAVLQDDHDIAEQGEFEVMGDDQRRSAGHQATQWRLPARTQASWFQQWCWRSSG